MQKILADAIRSALSKEVPATGLAFFRILYGLVTFQEIIFLIYFSHLIFDPTPFLDVEFPMIPFFLGVWAIVSLFLTFGYRCQSSAIANYIFWLVFVSFTPMQRDFDGGFDAFMTGAGLFLIFLPIDRAASLDNLGKKLRNSNIGFTFIPPDRVSVLAYYLPVAICLGFLYFDSAVHKLWAEHWRNGLGAWLPSSHPYYISIVDMSWLLDIKPLQMAIGYTIIVFQFAFIFLFYFRTFRVPLLIIGATLHLGITVSFNIYPFGLGMLAFYSLLIPFSWWRKIGSLIRRDAPRLTVFFDEQCPLCNRTIIFFRHFDIFKAIDFKGLQTYSGHYAELNSIPKDQILKDLYSLDRKNRLYSGLDTYIQILRNMRYTAPLGLLLSIPGVHSYAMGKYRKIADNRSSAVCDIPNATENQPTASSLYDKYFEDYGKNHPKGFSLRLAKILIIVFFLQLNSTLHYGIFYRLGFDSKESTGFSHLATVSNSILMLTHTFIGITPHALYVHDHFMGYDRIIGITYIDADGKEKWLPFVNSKGRIVAPNWGRVHSMWANIAVTPEINVQRLKKFIMKITAFWGTKMGLDLDNSKFIIKLKKISSPEEWKKNLRRDNLATNWQNIGVAEWKDGKISIKLPDDINRI
ncbi:MAG: DCC1-like thiol-disulfide oxidoreductase family protein [Gammaproteobacteria bacterium]